MEDSIAIDCNTCAVRSKDACADCLVTVLLGAPPAGFDLEVAEVRAFGALAESGLVPPLRHVEGRQEPIADAG